MPIVSQSIHSKIVLFRYFFFGQNFGDLIRTKIVLVQNNFENKTII